jgi:pseudouridine-5'-phosphate glycosidase
MVVANPAPEPLDADLHRRVLAAALRAAERASVRGKDVTPFLLDYFHRETHGASLVANVALVRSNARLAAQIAVELSRSSGRLSADDPR